MKWIETVKLPDGCELFLPQDFFPMWEEFQDLPEFHEDDLLDQTYWLWKLCNSPAVVLKMPFGICWFDGILPKRSAQFSFIFFDRNLSGKEVVINAILEWGFREFDLKRLGVVMPIAYQAKMRFLITKLGFRSEGVLANFYVRGDKVRRACMLGRFKEV